MLMKKRIIGLLVVLALGAGGVSLYQRQAGGGARGGLVLFGNVDIRQVNLGFRVGGKLARLAFDEGDAVKAGDVLAVLDGEPYTNQLASAAAQVASLKARLALREAGNRPQEVAQARALVAEREVTARNAEVLFQRSEEMLAIKAVSRQERDNAEAAGREAAARLTSARENLGLLEAGFRVEDIAQAKADLQQAEAAVAVADLALKDTVLTAPSAGVVLTRAQEVGTILPPGATVFTVSLREPVWVRAYVAEPDLGRIHPGTKVAVTSDGRPGKPYAGTVGYISPRAEFTPKTVETRDLRTALVYRLRVVVTNADEGLRQGMPVTVRVEEAEGAK